MSDDGDEVWLTTAQVGALLGRRRSKSLVYHLVRDGKLPPPDVPGSSSMPSLWRRSAVDGAAREYRESPGRRGPEPARAVGMLATSQLASVLDCTGAAVRTWVELGMLPRSEGHVGASNAWRAEVVESLIADPPESWLLKKGGKLRVAAVREGTLVQGRDVAAMLGVPLNELGDAEGDGRIPRRVHCGGAQHGPLWRRSELEAKGLPVAPLRGLARRAAAEAACDGGGTRRTRTDGRRRAR